MLHAHEWVLVPLPQTADRAVPALRQISSPCEPRLVAQEGLELVGHVSNGDVLGRADMVCESVTCLVGAQDLDDLVAEAGLFESLDDRAHADGRDHAAFGEPVSDVGVQLTKALDVGQQRLQRRPVPICEEDPEAPSVAPLDDLAQGRKCLLRVLTIDHGGQPHDAQPPDDRPDRDVAQLREELSLHHECGDQTEIVRDGNAEAQEPHEHRVLRYAQTEVHARTRRDVTAQPLLDAQHHREDPPVPWPHPDLRDLVPVVGTAEVLQEQAVKGLGHRAHQPPEQCP